jgi:hypothetical protein
MNDGWLYGWKMISGYLNCSIRTAKRYHWHFKMPVRRGPRNQPIALKGEVDQWLIEFDTIKKSLKESG